MRVFPYFDKEEYAVNSQNSTLRRVYRPPDYTSDASEEVHPSIKSLTAAEWIPMIQWPPRRVTANFLNSYEYRETSLKPAQRDISHTVNGDDSLLTAAIKYHLAEEMQLRSR
jgi:hypothetical protein